MVSNVSPEYTCKLSFNESTACTAIDLLEFTWQVLGPEKCLAFSRNSKSFDSDYIFAISSFGIKQFTFLCEQPRLFDYLAQMMCDVALSYRSVCADKISKDDMFDFNRNNFKVYLGRSFVV